MIIGIQNGTIILTTTHRFPTISAAQGTSTGESGRSPSGARLLSQVLGSLCLGGFELSGFRV